MTNGRSGNNKGRMLHSEFNLNYLRVFYWVYQKKSMTDAAKELHLTQSGVSQHIRSLEEVLGVKLFDRLHRKLIPCPAADHLFEQCLRSFKDLENLILQLQPASNKALKGPIRVGLPEEFGTNIVLPLIAEFGGEHPETRFEIRFGLAAEINSLLLEGKLDLGVVDHFQLDPRIHLEPIYSETLHLCAHPELHKSAGPFKNRIEFYAQLPFIAYQPGEPVLKMWFEHHFQKNKTSLNVRASAVNVQGVVSLVLARLGAGVLPNYVIEKLKAQGQELQVYKASGAPLENAISVARLMDRSLSPAQNEFFQFLRRKVKSL